MYNLNLVLCFKAGCSSWLSTTCTLSSFILVILRTLLFGVALSFAFEVTIVTKGHRSRVDLHQDYNSQGRRLFKGRRGKREEGEREYHDSRMIQQDGSRLQSALVVRRWNSAVSALGSAELAMGRCGRVGAQKPIRTFLSTTQQRSCHSKTFLSCLYVSWNTWKQR